MTARVPGTVISTSRFHLGTRWGGQRTRTRLKPARCAAAAAIECLAGAHLADDGGAPVGFEGEGRAPYGVGLRPQGLAEQAGEPVAVLRGPVEGRVGLHHPLSDG